MKTWRSVWALVVWTIVAAVLVISCGGSADDSAPVTQPTRPAPVGADRGAVVRAEDPTVESDGSRRQVVTYRSTSGVDGSGTEVTGTVFTPQGVAPDGGWPVVTVGHGTTGVEDDCAPSAYPDLLGSRRLVTPLLDRGYVVVVSDLQGLGTPGPHPYLEPATAAYNLIDAVRAARNAVSGTSPRWAALGLSQGGQASWAAAEYAATYGDGLEFVGSANLSPAVDISAVIDQSGNVDLKVPQQVFIPSLLAGLAVLHPELNPDDYLHGTLAAQQETFLACSSDKSEQRLSVALQISPDDTRPVSPEAAARMKAWLTEIALPRQRATGPMLVVVGQNDPVIFARWTRAAVDRACALGDVVAFHERAGEGHGDSDSIPEAVEWLADRFAGVQAPSTCGGAGG